jgi:hypothetical protein
MISGEKNLVSLAALPILVDNVCKDSIEPSDSISIVIKDP